MLLEAAVAQKGKRGESMRWGSVEDRYASPLYSISKGMMERGEQRPGSDRENASDT